MFVQHFVVHGHILGLTSFAHLSFFQSRVMPHASHNSSTCYGGCPKVGALKICVGWTNGSTNGERDLGLGSLGESFIQVSDMQLSWGKAMSD